VGFVLLDLQTTHATLQDRLLFSPYQINVGVFFIPRNEGCARAGHGEDCDWDLTNVGVLLIYVFIT
jgi:hypothetical protein